MGMKNFVITKKLNIQDLNSLIITIKKFKPDFIFHLAAQAIVKNLILIL